MKRDLFLVLLIAAVAVGWLVFRVERADPDAAALSGTALLNTAPESFKRVTGPEPLSFPADHAVHPGYRNEWWYFTGNLAAADGRRFGFQFTLFRFAAEPFDAPDSPFSADAVWMAHLAVSDIDQRRFISRERFARGALGLAGATEDRWWLRDWEVVRTDSGWRLTAALDDGRVELALDPAKPIVLQGERGYSQKGPDPGNASRYYSITRMQASGRLQLGGATHDVDGTAWLDREWGSSQLGEGIAGWDWFALQFDDGRDLMVYRLRTEDDRASRFSAGVLVQPDGDYEVLERDDFELEPTRRWTDRTGSTWPVAWRVRVPDGGLDLEVRPTFDEQRWYASFGYWEGAVSVVEAGTQQPVGRGYLELSGYADRRAAPPTR